MSYNQQRCAQCGEVYRTPEGTLSKVCGVCAVKVDTTPPADPFHYAEKELAVERSKLETLEIRYESLSQERDDIKAELSALKVAIDCGSTPKTPRPAPPMDSIKQPFAYEVDVAGTSLRLESTTIAGLLDLIEKVDQ